MRFRKLRIVWSVVWGVVALLLVVFWVRSSRSLDSLFVKYFGSHSIKLISYDGRVAIALTATGYPDWLTSFHSQPSKTIVVKDEHGRIANAIWPQVLRWKNLSELHAPHWCLVLLAILLAALPWLRWRFSLRTLLIATTLIAVLLGVVVWAAR